MSTAVELMMARRARVARAGLEAQRQAQAAIREAVVVPIAEKGLKGEKGDKGDKPAHQWIGTGLRFENPNGEWGDLVDLKGAKGARGDRGQGGGGASAGSATPPMSPTFTYVDGMLTGVLYADGSTKALTWASGRLSRLDFARPSARTVRKEFSYNGDGTLAAVAQTTL